MFFLRSTISPRKAAWPMLPAIIRPPTKSSALRETILAAAAWIPRHGCGEQATTWPDSVYRRGYSEGAIHPRTVVDSGTVNGQISTGKLTECQHHAVDGVYAAATAGFIRWLAHGYEARIDAFRRRVGELRKTGIE